MKQHAIYENNPAVQKAIQRGAEIIARETWDALPVMVTAIKGTEVTYSVESNSHVATRYAVELDMWNGRVYARCNCLSGVPCCHFGAVYERYCRRVGFARTVTVNGMNEIAAKGKKALADLYGEEITSYELEAVA